MQESRRPRLRGGPVLLVGALLALGLGTLGVPAQALTGQQARGHGAPARTFFVAPTGDDGAAGTRGAPWKTVARASQAVLNPGDSLLLRRGGTYAGTLRITSSGTPAEPVRVGAWDSGEPPTLTGGCVQLDGSWLRLTQVRTQDCDWAGVSVSGDDDLVADSITRRNVAGVYVRPGAERTQVLRNQVLDNDRMSVNTPGGNDDSGAFGVLVRGDHTRVAWNQIIGHHAMSYDYGIDGAAVEVYGAIGTRVDHNVARDNNTFSELGNARTRDSTYAFNVVSSAQDDATFLITRGAKSSWGPVTNTYLVHNTASLTGAHSQGFVCHGGCSPSILGVRSNVITAGWKAGYADGVIRGGSNLYFGGIVQFTMLPGDRICDPRFVDPKSGNLALRATSPAVDTGTKTRYVLDQQHESMPRDGNGDGVSRPDIGALERQPGRAWH